MIFSNWSTLAISTPYLLAVGANLCFGSASIVFSRFSKRYSANWVNQLKVSVSLIGFLAAFLLFESFTNLPIKGHFYLLFSGFLGLFFGDFFLFGSLAKLGPTRTLVLYTFEPLLVGFYGYLFLGQNLSSHQMIAVGCMIACVLTFMFERNHKTGSFEVKTFAFAFLGVFFDAIGVMFSRQAYELDHDLGSFQVNLTRATGALIGFFVLSPKFLSGLKRDLKEMGPADRNWALSACIVGTFLSLSLYLTALKTAHVATLTAISITSPLWVSLIEHLQHREWPNRFLWTAFALFLAGFALMQFQ
jgi:drug/metabolite transporter (DMT)-like permease